jgi:FAD/FMN-containing dehydrogenase
MTTDATPESRPSVLRDGGRSRSKRVLAAVLVATAVLFYPIRKAVQYAADPTGPKDCPPLEPETASPATILLRAAPPANLQWRQQSGSINDASCLNRTPVYGVVQVRTVEDVRSALQFAAANGLKVSAAGVRHSMGGQAFARGALVLDMTRFSRMMLDESTQTLRVESGASWHDIQSYLHPKYAVKAMQSTDIFTVGGSISVNAHGMDHRAGSVGRTIRAMRVMLADGSIRQVSRSEDPELFSLVVGGYGLFGIILDVDLEVTPNAIYRSGRRILDYREFPEVFTREIQPDRRYALMYGHLSTAPQSFLKEMILYTYQESPVAGATIAPLGEVSHIKFRRLVFNLSRQGALAMRLKWFAEKYLEPRLESCTVSRNQALGDGEACLVSRNEPMHDSVPYLRNALPEYTDILHEYFVPRAHFVPFIDGLRGAVQSAGANLLNASIRIVHREDSALTYAASDDMLAVVLYFSQTTTRRGRDQMSQLTRDLIDLCSAHGGRFFLPYQLHYTAAQLERAYPEIRAFFAAKRRVDPTELFVNTFYERFGK